MTPNGEDEHAQSAPVAQNNGRTQQKPDRWAHRRGEPRVFAFLWTLYLLGATLLGFGGLGVIGGISPDTYRPVARMILISVAVGIVILWPMTRLSQVKPRRHGVRVAAADFIVIAVPLQAVVLPQMFLPFGWQTIVVFALSALMTSWAMLIAGVLAIALGMGGTNARTPPRRGWVWMLLIVVAAAVAPITTVATTQSGTYGGIRTRWLGSPITGTYELTRERPHTSIAPTLRRGDWTAICVPGAIGCVLWLLAAARRSGAGNAAARESGV